MNKIAIVLIFLPMLALLAFSQQDFEASGQTPVFFLKAGTTTHTVSTINLKPKGFTLSNYFVTYKYRTIRIQALRSKTKISIYNLSGKLMTTVNSAIDGSASFSSILPNGIYFAQFKTIDEQLAVPLSIKR